MLLDQESTSDFRKGGDFNDNGVFWVSLSSDMGSAHTFGNVYGN